MVSIDFNKVNSAIIDNAVIISTLETNGFIISKESLNRYGAVCILNHFRYISNKDISDCSRNAITELYNQLII